MSIQVLFKGGAKVEKTCSTNRQQGREFLVTLQGTKISPKNGILKMIFLFPRWDMLISWRVHPSFWIHHRPINPPGRTSQAAVKACKDSSEWVWHWGARVQWVFAVHLWSMKHFPNRLEMVPKKFELVVSIIFYVQPYLGKRSNLTTSFQMSWNHQLLVV